MISKALTYRYASALLKELQQNEYEEVQQNLSSFIELYKKSTDLGRFLKNPFVAAEDQVKVITQICKLGKFSAKVESFLSLLIENERINCIEQIAETFSQLVEDLKGTIEAEIYSPVQLENDELKRIKSKLKSMLQKNIITKLHIDPSLVAGITIRIGDKIIDASIAGSLSSIRKSFLEGR